ncbi:MAG: beta-glucosidase BglX, partial [Turicibacter sp.]
LFFGVEQDVDLTGPFDELNIEESRMTGVGSTLNYFGAANVKKLQDEYMEKNRLNIPMLFMADVIYGYKTIFPIPLAMGCSFNPKNYYYATKIAAKECSASGIQLTFAPMSDLVRDPRWGRVMESPGEDPYLNSIMTAAAVKGFQGDNPKNKGSIAACVKHFAGYGASEGGRDYNWVDLSTHSLRQYYLPSYKAAIDAGVKMVMTAFNVVDGIPASANKKLFRDILRDEWGFKGVTISDYAAIDETVINGYTKNGQEAAKACIEAGVDIEMMSSHYMNYAKELVEAGKLSIELIDQAVRNILVLKDDLGLFENPYKDADEEMERKLHKCPEHLQKAREVARESVVLLKNEEILPLKPTTKVGIAGPYTHSDNTMGGWSLTDKKNANTLASALEEKGLQVVTEMTDQLGAMQHGIFDVEDRVQEVIEAFKDCDVVIAAVGENPSDSGEAASRTNLRLSPNQEKLIQELHKLNKPVVMIVFSGRPLELSPVVPYCQGIIQAWFLGTESSGALADILIGDYNPSGRLSMSFPQTVGQIPVHYNCYNTGRPSQGKVDRYVSRYLDCSNEPLYPFGYGLSYGQVAYKDFDVIEHENGVKAKVTLENTSDKNVKETVQLYIRDLYASVVRPIKELKGFKQIELNAFETCDVEFEITKDMLKFYNHELEYVFESGDFEIMVGRNSTDVTGKVVYID